MSGPVTPPLEVTEVDGSPDGRPITKIVVSNGDLTVSGRTATIDTSGSATSFPLLGTDGSAAAPTYSFASETDTGMYRSGLDEISFTQGSTQTVTLGAGAVSLLGDTKLFVGDGGVTNPTLSFISDTNLGFYRPSTDILGFVANDAERLRFGAAGQIGIEGANYGTSGQVFSSGGSGAKPTWEDGGMASFNVAGDTGATQTITDGNTLTIKNAAGGAIKTVGVATDELTIDLTVSGVSAASYTSTDLTVDAQGRITAASSGSGGGNDFNTELCGTELDSDGTGYAVFDVLSLPPYGVARYNTVTIDTKQYFFPFISPFSGDLATLYYNITSAAGSATNLYLAVYADNEGVPSDVMGYATIDATVAGSASTTSFSSTITCVRGTQYWVSYNKSTTQALILRGIDNAYCPRISPSSGFPSTTAGYSTNMSTNSSFSSTPANITADGLEPGVVFAGLGYKPHVGFAL